MEELHQDHINLTRVFNILEQLSEILSTNGDPDLFLMIDIFDYVQHYPDLVHHPKEDKIYDVLMNRSIEGAKYLVQLSKEHQYLPTLSNELYKIMDSAANSTLFVSREELQSKIEFFLRIERKHMDLEEKIVFPMINKTLTDEDWDSIEVAILDKNDPLFGDSLEACYKNLFESIKKQVGS